MEHLKNVLFLHPINDLNLKRIACDPDILNRFQTMTFFFCDEKGNKVNYHLAI